MSVQFGFHWKFLLAVNYAELHGKFQFALVMEFCLTFPQLSSVFFSSFEPIVLKFERRTNIVIVKDSLFLDLTKTNRKSTTDWQLGILGYVFVRSDEKERNRMTVVSSYIKFFSDWGWSQNCFKLPWRV